MEQQRKADMQQLRHDLSEQQQLLENREMGGLGLPLTAPQPDNTRGVNDGLS